MKPLEDARTELVREWLRKADADLRLAEHILPDAGEFANAVAFHCQQAVEKYLKALLTWGQVDFPKSHDLERLLELVGPFEPELVESVADVIILTPFGVELRYPGDRPDASADFARRAVELAAMVRDEVGRRLPVVSEER